MIRFALLSGFFLALALDEILDLGLLITTGLSAKNAFLYVLLLTIVFTSASNRRGQSLQLPEFHLLFLGLIGVACLGVFYRQFAGGQAPTFGLFAEMAFIKTTILDSYLMHIVFYYGVASQGMARVLSRFVLLVISVVALITVADTAGLLNLELVTYRNERLEGPLGQANEYAVFLSFFIPFLGLMALNCHGWLMRAVYVLGAVISFALLIQTGSRGGFVSLIGGFCIAGIVLWGGYDLRRVLVWAFLALLVAFGIVAISMVTDEAVRELVLTRLEATFGGGVHDASAGRTGVWLEGLEYQLARPWSLATGLGLGEFTAQIGIPAHSAYVNYLFSLGLLGLGLFVAIVTRILAHGRRAFLSPAATHEERTLVAAMVIGWCALVLAMVTGTIYKAWLFVWPMTGLCLYLAVTIREEQANREAAAAADQAPFITPTPWEVRT